MFYYIYAYLLFVNKIAAILVIIVLSSTPLIWQCWSFGTVMLAKAYPSSNHDATVPLHSFDSVDPLEQ